MSRTLWRARSDVMELLLELVKYNCILLSLPWSHQFGFRSNASCWHGGFHLKWAPSLQCRTLLTQEQRTELSGLSTKDVILHYKYTSLTYSQPFL
jgi:hypothetical protein